MFKEKFLTSGTLIGLENGNVLIGSGKREWLSILDQQEEGFYFPDFFLASFQPWFKQNDIREISIDELLHLLPLGDEPTIPLHWENPFKALFLKEFDRLQCNFKQGTLKKAVPYVFEKSPHHMNTKTLLSSLRKALLYAKNNKAFIYGFWDDQQGILGVTPEILFSFQEKMLQTMACAGTYRRGQGTKEQLLQDPKERNEHELVIQSIQEALSRFGSVKTGDTSVLELPSLLHLLTPIEATIEKSISFHELVTFLHPTPALGAIPKKEGMQWLSDYQTLIPRERFGAPVGCMRKGGESHCLVGIRNVQWSPEGMRIGAGCGVVEQSNPESEWMEICAKIQSVKNILGFK